MFCCIWLLFSSSLFSQITTFGGSKIYIGEGALVFVSENDSVNYLIDEAKIINFSDKSSIEEGVALSLISSSKKNKAVSLASSKAKKSSKKLDVRNQQNTIKIKQIPANENYSNSHSQEICFVPAQFRYTTKPLLLLKNQGITYYSFSKKPNNINKLCFLGYNSKCVKDKNLLRPPPNLFF